MQYSKPNNIAPIKKVIKREEKRIKQSSKHLQFILSPSPSPPPSNRPIYTPTPPASPGDVYEFQSLAEERKNQCQ